MRCCSLDETEEACSFVAAFELRGRHFEDIAHVCVKHLHLMVGPDDDLHIITGPDGTYEQNVFEMAYGSEPCWQGKSQFVTAEMEPVNSETAPSYTSAARPATTRCSDLRSKSA